MGKGEWNFHSASVGAHITNNYLNAVGQQVLVETVIKEREEEERDRHIRRQWERKKGRRRKTSQFVRDVLIESLFWVKWAGLFPLLLFWGDNFIFLFFPLLTDKQNVRSDMLAEKQMQLTQRPKFELCTSLISTHNYLFFEGFRMRCSLTFRLPLLLRLCFLGYHGDVFPLCLDNCRQGIVSCWNTLETLQIHADFHYNRLITSCIHEHKQIHGFCTKWQQKKEKQTK